MKRNEVLKECFQDGPGLDGYAYQAAVYCSDCARKIVEKIPQHVLDQITDSLNDPLFKDSETIPQPIFFGESEEKQHCDSCEEYLYGGDLPHDEEEKNNG